MKQETIRQVHGNYLPLITGLIFATLASASGGEQQGPNQLESAYRFLVTERDQGGILYTATAGQLKGRQLPLSFHDTAAYWGEHVCGNDDCRVIDHYDPYSYTLSPQDSEAADLQTERVNTHNGTNIYDAATWQIAVMLGAQRNGFPLPGDRDAYELVSHQNILYQNGYFGDSPYPVATQTRAVTAGDVFVYNRQRIEDPHQAFCFRMLPRQWLAEDPFMGTKYSGLLSGAGLPVPPGEYSLGRISWTDWKPITGENSWAFLIGPLQAAAIHYQIDRPAHYVPFEDPALVNACQVLPTFAAMQSSVGGVYYAPAGTVANKGTTRVDPFFVAVENNISLYAGIRILTEVLNSTLARQANLQPDQREQLTHALQLCKVMQFGGAFKGRSTKGLQAFLKKQAWRQGEFVQGGWADKQGLGQPWQPAVALKAVDVNTWGVAAIGAKTIDDWHGFGSTFHLWQAVKSWGGYGEGTTLWGVGFSNQDGGGIDAQGIYRRSVLSAEWSYGAITMVRDMLHHYQSFTGSGKYAQQAEAFCTILKGDEQSMLAAMEKLQLKAYKQSHFPGQPAGFPTLIALPTNPTLYASRRFFIPFGWYANPLPSTCATAWKVMVANNFNPFRPISAR